jgi:hypothetical protein
MDEEKLSREQVRQILLQSVRDHHQEYHKTFLAISTVLSEANNLRGANFLILLQQMYLMEVVFLEKRMKLQVDDYALFLDAAISVSGSLAKEYCDLKDKISSEQEVAH